MSSEAEENWVRYVLIPELLKNNSLIKNLNNNDDENFNKNLNNFNLRDIQIKYLTTDEAFMLTKCYKTKINYEYNDELYTITLVVKQTPNITEDKYNSISFDSLYHNEILAYTEILPILNTTLNYPKYYYSYRKHMKAVMVLEDFSTDGWKMTKSKINLSLDHILLAAKAIGEFHGAGFALKSIDPNTFNKLTSSLRECRFTTDDILSDWLTTCTVSPRRTIAVAKKYQHQYDHNIPDEFLNNLLKLIGNTIQYFKKRIKPVEPYATICHGDYLRNNVAFKYENDLDTAKPIDIILFDFQTLRYSSAMVDLCIFLSLSAGKDVRVKNFETIFRAYHNQLTKVFCEKTETKLEDLPSHLSYDNLIKEYVRYLPYALSVASTFLMNLHDMNDFSIEEILAGVPRSEEEVIKDIFTRGGDAVDIELAALVHELYDFCIKYNIDIFEEFL